MNTALSHPDYAILHREVERAQRPGLCAALVCQQQTAMIFAMNC